MTPSQAELLELLQRHTKEDRLHETPVTGLHLLRFSSPSRPLYATQWPCLAVLAQGSKTLSFGDTQLRYRPGEYLLASVDMPVTSCVLEASPSRPMLGLGFTIDPAELRQVARRLEDLSRVPSDSGAAVHSLDPPLMDALVRLVRLLDTPQDAKVLAPVIGQEILYRLLVGPSGKRLLEIAKPDSAGDRMARAVRLLRESFSRSFKVEDLAREVGMSPSSFHQHFKTVHQMTPIQYQKLLRLHEARRLLLTENRAVGDAGFQVGYQSPSQFTKDYRRYFGNTPRDDIRTYAGAAARGEWSPNSYTPLES